MSAAVIHSITLNNVSLPDDELKRTDKKATEEAVNPKRAKALSRAATRQIGKALLGAAKDISSSMRSSAGDELAYSASGEAVADVGESIDDYRADVDSTESMTDGGSEPIEDEDRPESDTGSDAEDGTDGNDHGHEREHGGDGRSRQGQSEGHREDDPEPPSVVIDGGRPRRREPRAGEQLLPPGAGKMLVDDLEAAYKKVEVTLRQVGGMAMNLPVKMDQLTHAPELMLMQLNMELSQIIDQALYSQLADQKSRNAMIADHQTMMDALRIEKGSIGDTEKFDWTAHNPDIALHPESPARSDSAQLFASLANHPSIKKIVELFPDFKLDGIVPIVDKDGNTAPYLWLKPAAVDRNIVKTVHVGSDTLGAEAPEIEGLVNAYGSALKAEESGNPGSIKLMDCLKLYGIIVEGKEPKNGGEVDAHIQKIKGVVDKLSSSQQLDMVRLQKMTNSRNEAFSMISNVNKQALDNRMAIVNNLR